MSGYECAHCGEREGTAKYSAEGGAMAVTHGFWEWWCEPCVLRAQIDHARERAAALPELERKLAAASGQKDAPA